MCATCGCGSAEVRMTIGSAVHQHDHDHDHDHGHGHDHDHDHDHDFEHDRHALLRPAQGPNLTANAIATVTAGLATSAASEADGHGSTARQVQLEQDLLAKNDAIAAHNRRWLEQRQILALNLLSGPGAGKTSLLERTIRELAPAPVSVLEGDQDTTHDADRVRAAGATALQINTGRGCHLDAAMIRAGLNEIAPVRGSLLFVENVGNLVCPALFDLGERAKVVLLSVTEGEDKPLKYPHAFRNASVLVLSKIDLLPHLDFDLERCLHYARQINPQLRVFQLSARRGDGMAAWCDWLRSVLGAVTELPEPNALLHE